MSAEPNTSEHTLHQQLGSDVLRIVLSTAGLVYLSAVALNAEVTKVGLTEAVIFAAILLFNSKVFASLTEMSISSKGIAFKVREVEQRQLNQEDEIKALKWLIASVATDYESGYLQKLCKNGVADYNNGDQEHDGYFKFELRRLRERGLIEMLPSQTVGAMPVKGNLKDFCQITEDGKKYLALRKKLEAVA